MRNLVSFLIFTGTPVLYRVHPFSLLTCLPSCLEQLARGPLARHRSGSHRLTALATKPTVPQRGHTGQPAGLGRPHRRGGLSVSTAWGEPYVADEHEAELDSAPREESRVCLTEEDRLSPTARVALTAPSTRSVSNPL